MRWAIVGKIRRLLEFFTSQCDLGRKMSIRRLINLISLPFKTLVRPADTLALYDVYGRRSAIIKATIATVGTDFTQIGRWLSSGPCGLLYKMCSRTDLLFVCEIYRRCICIVNH